MPTNILDEVKVSWCHFILLAQTAGKPDYRNGVRYELDAP